MKKSDITESFINNTIEINRDMIKRGSKLINTTLISAQGNETTSVTTTLAIPNIVKKNMIDFRKASVYKPMGG